MWAFKSLGLSCNHLALMKEERDQRNSSGFETEKKHSALTSPSRFVSNDSFALVVNSEQQPLNQNSRFKPSGDKRKFWIRHDFFTVNMKNETDRKKKYDDSNSYRRKLVSWHALCRQFDEYPQDWGRSNQHDASRRWFVIHSALNNIHLP